jgi:hypothetical protein
MSTADTTTEAFAGRRRRSAEAPPEQSIRLDLGYGSRVHPSTRPREQRMHVMLEETGSQTVELAPTERLLNE